MNTRILSSGAMLLIMLLLSTGCSDKTTAQDTPAISDPGPTTPVVSGVAAAGVPISGSITLKDRTGRQLGPRLSDLNGKFSFDVTGLTPPYILKAEWIAGSQSHSLFSVNTTGTGRANINPLSHAILYLASSIDPSLMFGTENMAPDVTQMTSESLATALAKLKALLTPLMDLYGIPDFDPMSGAYAATPDNRLDAMLDVVMLTQDNGALTITNKLNGSLIAAGSLADIAGMTVNVANAPEASTLTDIKDLADRLDVLRAAMNLGTALTADHLEGLFMPDPYYGTSSGLTRAADIESIVAIFGPNGINTNGRLAGIQNVRLVSDLTANYGDRGVSKVYLLNYDFIHENGTVVHGNNVTFGKELSSGLWKFIGDPDQGTGGDNYGLVVTTP